MHFKSFPKLSHWRKWTEDVVVIQPLKIDGLKSWQTDKETDGIGSHVYLNTLIVGDEARLLL